MNPYGAGAGAARSVADVRANVAILQYVQGVGLVFLGDASPVQICLSLQQHDNSTLVLAGIIDGHQCQGAPRAFQGEASLALDLPMREETIQAWTVVQ